MNVCRLVKAVLTVAILFSIAGGMVFLLALFPAVFAVLGFFALFAFLVGVYYEEYEDC